MVFHFFRVFFLAEEENTCYHVFPVTDLIFQEINSTFRINFKRLCTKFLENNNKNWFVHELLYTTYLLRNVPTFKKETSTAIKSQVVF